MRCALITVVLCSALASCGPCDVAGVHCPRYADEPSASAPSKSKRTALCDKYVVDTTPEDASEEAKRVDVQIRLGSELSGAFVTRGAVVMIDDRVAFCRDELEIPRERKLVAVHEAVPPGDYAVGIVLRLQGNGVGPFAYLRGYEIELKSSRVVAVKAARRVDAIVWERGDKHTPIERRPALRYVETTMTQKR